MAISIASCHNLYKTVSCGITLFKRLLTATCLLPKGGEQRRTIGALLYYKIAPKVRPWRRVATATDVNRSHVSLLTHADQ